MSLHSNYTPVSFVSQGQKCTCLKKMHHFTCSHLEKKERTNKMKHDYSQTEPEGNKRN